MKFLREKHISYIRKVSSDTESFEFLVSQHLRMSGVYWGLTALSLLGVNLKEESNAQEILQWVMTCYDPETGGFGGNVHHDAHLLYTLSAVQILALYDEMDRLDREKIQSFVHSLQQPDGCLHNGPENCPIDLPKAIAFIQQCQNFDGGYGAVPGGESHAGQIFCCIGALSIAEALDSVPVDLLAWWLAERQCDSGGLNGRPEKQADVCYSWWILSSLSILGRTSFIDREKLCDFILACQEGEGGGIADRPSDLSDIFHTFFGICGLLLSEYFSSILIKRIENKQKTDGENTTDDDLETIEEVENLQSVLKQIDPTYALPREVVKRLGLRAQVLPAV
eukprot:scaffold360_cov186-Ochromonas_danica.AAC.1